MGAINLRNRLTADDILKVLKEGDGITFTEIDNCKVEISASGLTCLFERITFDVTNDTLPITPTAGTTNLIVDFFNFDANIDVTAGLPTNLPKGARMVLRKNATGPRKIIYTDGFNTYSFINKKSEYLVLWYDGTSWVI